MQDRPTASELLTAVRRFLEQDVVTAFEGRRRFHALVAANVLAIVERELACEEQQLLGEWQRLGTLLSTGGDEPPRLELLRDAVRTLDAELTSRIRRGDADAGPFAEAVRRHLRATVVDKLRIANPRALGEA